MIEPSRGRSTGYFDESEDTAWKQTLVALTKHSFCFQPMTGVRSRGGVVGRPQMTPNDAGHAYDDGTRRTEILQTAALLIATSGLRTSLQEIADAAGILPGSLYHHFESKEALLVE